MPSVKPFCKVCRDAGKPENDYSSHWVKDRSGKTVCPTLLATQCRYCKKFGHIAKYCSVIIKNDQMKNKDERRKEWVSAKTNTQTIAQKPNNLYDLLDESDSDNDTNNEEKEFPALTKGVIRVNNQRQNGDWVAIVSKMVDKPQTASVASVAKKNWACCSDSADSEDDDHNNQVVPRNHIVLRNPRKNWADWSDSDDDEDDDDEDRYGALVTACN